MESCKLRIICIVWFKMVTISCLLNVVFKEKVQHYCVRCNSDVLNDKFTSSYVQSTRVVLYKKKTSEWSPYHELMHRQRRYFKFVSPHHFTSVSKILVALCLYILDDRKCLSGFIGGILCAHPIFNTDFKHRLLTQTSNINFRHTLNHSFQTLASDTDFRRTPQTQTSDTDLKHRLHTPQTQTSDIHLKHRL